jgi:hypothetical protein
MNGRSSDPTTKDQATDMGRLMSRERKRHSEEREIFS